jgi:exportin-2 (importin alpha re-exporter)
MCLYVVRFSGPSLIETCDSIQPNLFAMVVERLFIPEVQKVAGSTEKKICTVGLTRYVLI